MQKIEADYEIVTPMFIGAGDRHENPEVRPPSIKGALRFWWRALQWGACLKQAGDNPEQALHELHKQEAELFGAAFKDDKYGQGLCTLKLKGVITKGVEENWPISNNNSGAGFLGYGLDKTKDESHRKAIAHGQFTVCLMLKKGISSEQIQQLKNTLTIWGLLGGLGSRARRGFGSVAIKRLDEKIFEFDNFDQYDTAINHLLNTVILAPEMPIFTALNEAMTIAQAGQGNDVRCLMDCVGSQYKTARKEAGAGLAKLPFGLPLAGTRGASEKDRRSSPLFMHMHPIGKQFVAMVSFIPADFHPDYPEGNTLEFYKPIQDYMQPMERVYP
jgi:CRISPR-associated protein Cmr1